MSGSLLQSAQTKQLLTILFSSTAQPFQASAAALQEAFAPASRFPALCSALLLLQESKALLLPQRLATWYLLFSTWPDGPAGNPFVSFLFRACEDDSTAASERALCLQLLTQQALTELGATTPQDYVLTRCLRQPQAQQLDDALRGHIQQRYVCVQQLQQRGAREPPDGPASSLAPAHHTHVAQGTPSQAVTGTAAPGQTTGVATDSIAGASSSRGGSGADAGSSGEGHQLQLPPGSVPWLRPLPTPLALMPGELRWLYPDLHTDLIWDSTLGERGAEASEVHDLVARALRAPLLPAQQQRVLAALEAHPKLVHRLGLQPQHLPSLVEHCPALASAVLLRMLRPVPSSKAPELLAALARSEMSLHGMEVVNRLAASVELPPEFIHLYITNCINSCVSTQDKYVQSRLVRLVCVFLQSLIRNRILAAMDLLHELQAFCINFSRIREAAKLFRLLKQIEAGGAGCLSPGALAHGTLGLEGPAGVTGRGSGGGTAAAGGNGHGHAHGLHGLSGLATQHDGAAAAGCEGGDSEGAGDGDEGVEDAHAPSAMRPSSGGAPAASCASSAIVEAVHGGPAVLALREQQQ